jgi:hypothetical protein
VNCLLGCIFTWSGSSSYVNNPVFIEITMTMYASSISTDFKVELLHCLTVT